MTTGHPQTSRAYNTWHAPPTRLLELSGAVAGERERKDDHQAGARQAARLLRRLRHVAQGPQLDEGARLCAQAQGS